VSKRITLPAWAERNFEKVPHRITLERWARLGNIQPPPVKVGRAWMVSSDAKYVDRHGNVAA
jgi:predicted site-specific integrase-resolvase